MIEVKREHLPVNMQVHAPKSGVLIDQDLLTNLLNIRDEMWEYAHGNSEIPLAVRQVLEAILQTGRSDHLWGRLTITPESKSEVHIHMEACGMGLDIRMGLVPDKPVRKTQVLSDIIDSAAYILKQELSHVAHHRNHSHNPGINAPSHGPCP